MCAAAQGPPAGDELPPYGRVFGGQRNAQRFLAVSLVHQEHFKKPVVRAGGGLQLGDGDHVVSGVGQARVAPGRRRRPQRRPARSSRRPGPAPWSTSPPCRPRPPAGAAEPGPARPSGHRGGLLQGDDGGLEPEAPQAGPGRHQSRTMASGSSLEKAPSRTSARAYLPGTIRTVVAGHARRSPARGGGHVRRRAPRSGAGGSGSGPRNPSRRRSA